MPRVLKPPHKFRIANQGPLRIEREKPKGKRLPCILLVVMKRIAEVENLLP